VKKIGSLSCRDLRREGFKPGNPPNLCEKLAKRTIKFGIGYVGNALEIKDEI